MRVKSFVTANRLKVELGRLNVLVGPNNVGKSRTLKDLRTYIASENETMVIAESVELELPATYEGLVEGVVRTPRPDSVALRIGKGFDPTLVNGEQRQFTEAEVAGWYKKGDVDSREGELRRIFGKFRVAHLDAATRLRVAACRESVDPSTAAYNTLIQGLLDDREAAERLNQVFQEIYGVEIRVDYSRLKVLCLRVADKFPEELPLHPVELRTVMTGYQTLDEQGDGYRSLAGVLMALLLARNRVLLIDEPEAFLHPAQARRLGAWVAKLANTHASQVIVATHNAAFLTGVLGEGRDVSVFRLDREGDSTTYQRIEPRSLESLNESPLMSSQRVADSVFQRGVVVCEGDSDRLYYESVATRLSPDHQIQFLNAHGKQTLKDVTELVTAAGIPKAVIADFDLLQASEDVAGLVKAVTGHEIDPELRVLRTKVVEDVEGRPESEIMLGLVSGVAKLGRQLEREQLSPDQVLTQLNRIRKAASDWANIKRDGISALSPTTRPDAELLLSKLEALGIFLVPVGKLESWVDADSLGGRKWIVAALRQISHEEVPKGVARFLSKVAEFVR